MRIALLEKFLGWDNNPQRLFEFIKRQISQDKKVSQLSKFEAGKIIIGMQKILACGSKDIYDWINDLRNNELNQPQTRLVIEAIYEDNPKELTVNV